MKEIKITSTDTLNKILNLVLTSQSQELKLLIDEGSVLFKNFINLKILYKISKQSNIILKLETSSDEGKNLISKLWKDQKQDYDLIDESEVEDSIDLISVKKENKKMQLPTIKLPQINFVIPVIILTLIISLGGAYFFIISRLSAKVDIQVGAERFVKSFEVKLSTISNTDIQNKILRVSSVSNSYTSAKEIETTGKSDGGVKAAGEVKLVNSTSKDITVKSGTKLTYTQGTKSYIYLLTESVEVPAKTQTSTSPVTYVSGEKVSKAQALDYGSAYNLAAGKDLVVSGYSESELSAVVTSSFSGGVKNTSNAVSSEDLKNVSSQSLGDFKSSYTSSKISGDLTPLKNSEIYTITKETFSGKLSDPLDKIKVSQDINVQTMVYSPAEAKAFVSGSLKNLLPEGYELYGKDLEIEINALGNSDKTVLNSQQADAQITVRSYKVPVFDTNKIAKDLTGMQFDQVAEYMSKLDNVINYNIELNYGIPFVSNLPKETSKINVTISKQ